MDTRLRDSISESTAIILYQPVVPIGLQQNVFADHKIFKSLLEIYRIKIFNNLKTKPKKYFSKIRSAPPHSHFTKSTNNFVYSPSAVDFTISKE